ncbi:MAG: hypothetical protein ABGY41_20235 [Candidatus Poribacteria bacterium]
MRVLASVLLTCLVFVVGGCSATLVNHTATEGATASDVRFVDGDLTTHGVTEFLDTHETDGVSEATVTLPEPRVVSKMVVHSPNLLSYEVFVRDLDSGEWVNSAYHQAYKLSATKQTTVRLKGRPRTDAVLLRVLRTTGDSINRTKTLSRMNRAYENATSAGAGAYGLAQGRQAVDRALANASNVGDLRGAATIHEIELFGPVEAPE